MKRTVLVTVTVEVEVNESAFTPEFLAEFRESFYNFLTIEDHIKHLAQLEARGIYNLEDGCDFIEGYGDPALMGIKARETDVDTEILP